MCCFSWSDCKNPLRKKHCCSKDSISRITIITLVFSRDFWHCVSLSVSHPFENKDTISRWRSFMIWTMSSVLVLKFHWIISLKISTLGAVTPLLFFGVVSKYCALLSPQKTIPLVQWHCVCLFWEPQTTYNHQNPTKNGPLVQWHWGFFWGFQKTDHRYQQKYLK